MDSVFRFEQELLPNLRFTVFSSNDKIVSSLEKLLQILHFCPIWFQPYIILFVPPLLGFDTDQSLELREEGRAALTCMSDGLTVEILFDTLFEAATSTILCVQLESLKFIENIFFYQQDDKIIQKHIPRCMKGLLLIGASECTEVQIHACSTIREIIFECRRFRCIELHSVVWTFIQHIVAATPLSDQDLQVFNDHLDTLDADSPAVGVLVPGFIAELTASSSSSERRKDVAKLIVQIANLLQNPMQAAAYADSIVSALDGCAEGRELLACPTVAHFRIRAAAAAASAPAESPWHCTEGLHAHTGVLLSVNDVLLQLRRAVAPYGVEKGRATHSALLAATRRAHYMAHCNTQGEEAWHASLAALLLELVGTQEGCMPRSAAT